MIISKLGRALGATVVVVAVLNTLAALSMPVLGRKPALLVTVAWFVLLSLHAAAYRFGGPIRERLGLAAYVAIQAALLFAIAVSRVAAPITLGLFVACTVELVVLSGRRWGTVRITVGAIALFVVAAWLTSGLYFATTAGLVLAVTGLFAHALSGLLSRPAVPTIPGAPSTLSARESEVLRELVSGARSHQIAARLGISERTVKSHLGSIYQKLGVESRSAAVATALQRRLVTPKSEEPGQRPPR
ncbi:MAG TPA: LuxR C-terminal-related transcriptional regulator [Gemmatimonadales bacterium]|nr:LuxR C-terminal-related transcriptional regulator [Gemmatimonadales bacterium]